MSPGTGIQLAKKQMLVWSGLVWAAPGVGKEGLLTGSVSNQECSLSRN